MTAPLPDTALKLRVRNVLGIQRADLILDRLVLVCGINGAGKSSLLQCAAAGAMATAMIRGQGTRAKASRLLRNGADLGSVVMAYAGGETKITWPDAQVEQTGIPQTLGTAMGINAASFMALDSRDRAKEITARLGALPTKADLTAWLAQNPDTPISDENTALLWQRIEASGWDAVHGAAKEDGSRLKGRWEQITRDRFGARKASLWTAPGLNPDHVYDLAAAQAEVERLKERATELSRSVVAARSSRADLEARAGRLAAAQAKLEALTEEQSALSGDAERLAADRDALPDATDAAAYPCCPHCGKAVRVTRPAAEAALMLTKAPAALTGEALEMRRAERRAVLLAVEKIGADIEANVAAIVEARMALSDATRATADLARLAVLVTVSQGDIDQANDDWRAAGRKADGIKATAEAREVFEEWRVLNRMVDALAAEGVRASVMQQRVAGFNGKLAEVAKAAEFASVEMTDDFDATYDGRPYALLSESERWRVDLTIAVALGRMEKARLILVDRLDVLHAPARKGVLLMLRGLGIPALIGMTAKAVEDAPDLTAAKIGRRLWLNNGIIEGGA